MIFGKIHNARWSMERTLRDHGERVDAETFRRAIDVLKGQLPRTAAETDLDELRGIEGVAAKAYFDGFDDMLLRNKDAFFFHGRSRRPPLDRVNAMLSFAYALLASDCASALESVGLDSYVGLMHRDRPGRRSLALDLMEELRVCVADRLVLTMVNNRVIEPSDFEESGSGAVLLTDRGRKAFLKAWQEKKQETITHPFLQEKLPWGLAPYMQALLLARHIRGDLDAYPPFLWK
jgi:CRISPR-associated protein Cas1